MRALFLAASLMCWMVPALADENIVLRWNETTLSTIQATRTPPPLATRALAMTHTAMYDAWAAYDATAAGTQLGTTLRRPASEATPEAKREAMSFAAFRVLTDLYPTQLERFEALMKELGYEATNQSKDMASPAGIGNLAAGAVIEFRHADGSNQLGDLNPGAYSDYTGYKPVNQPGVVSNPNSWSPLQAADGTVQQWLLPHWGRVKGFALRAGSQYRLGWPPLQRNPMFQDRCAELVSLNANLTDKQKLIAEYWEDGAGTVTPPGHWNRLAQSVSRRFGHGQDRDVKLFFLLTNAQLDTGIAIWDSKRFFDYVRPISAIRNEYKGKTIEAWGGPGKGKQQILGENWQPYLTTPPFAEYPSGHSGFSASSAEILKLYLGDDTFGESVTFASGSSRIEPGVTPKQAVTLSWATFSDAADEAGLSRRLGGIHFEEADTRSRSIGRLAAWQVWDKAAALFDGAGVLAVR